MKTYIRAIPQTDAARPDNALSLAGGWCWFDHVEILQRGTPPVVKPVSQMPESTLAAACGVRAPLAGLSMSEPQIMGILNVTPDSFSDGGQHNKFDDAVSHAVAMQAAGATIIDIGGESTRPGSSEVDVVHEIERTAPVIEAVTPTLTAPVSIDTRKAPVAKAALAAGATIINDVAGFTFDADLGPLAAETQAPVCVMHAQGDPATMQDDPVYDDVLLDVYDFLEAQINYLVGLGVRRDQIVVDPGIGFGKTLAHNLAILSRISLYHSLGCPILLGASRKRLIGEIANVPDSSQRLPGSLAIAMAGLAQGIQIIRVHDVAEMQQAKMLWQASTKGEHYVS